MKTNDNLLAPAAQKFYSALKSLERFDKCNDFFDNVSSLDNFLSEYRNVTFVLQKSFSNAGLLSIYEEFRNKYLNDKLSKWFVDKRNEVLKEQPFPLQKTIVATIYEGVTYSILVSRHFSAEDDATYESIIKSLRNYLRNYSSIEIYFSVEFLYNEIETDENVFDKLFQGISKMYNFIMALNDRINDNGTLFHDIIDKINNLILLKANKSDLFIDDYVYYADVDEFERGSRFYIRLPETRIALSNIINNDIPWNVKDKSHHLFLYITSLHAQIYVMQRHRVMPTFFILYKDDTILIDSFDASLRTTFYRKINEVAERILAESGNIKSVIFVHEMWSYSSMNVLKKKYNDRVSTENPISLLACHMVDESIKSKSYYFEESKIDSKEYVFDKLKNGLDVASNLSFMTPILRSFEALKKI